VQQQVLQHPRELHLQHQQGHAHGHFQQQQQQQAPPAVTSALQASALSGVMFKSLGLHPMTLSGLHVSDNDCVHHCRQQKRFSLYAAAAVL
jgi:hypothetical protein